MKAVEVKGFQRPSPFMDVDGGNCASSYFFLRREWNGGTWDLEVIEETVGSADVEAFLGERDVNADADKGVSVAAARELPLAVLEIAGSVAYEQIDPVEP
jgi:hypothetical protein